MTSGGVFTWSLPPISGSGQVDPAWYTAYRFVVKTTDDGSVGGSPRNKYVPEFITADADVDLDGTRTKFNSPADWEVRKRTPIAVDDSLTTPVEVPTTGDVRGQWNLALQQGDKFSGTATFEKLTEPQHAAAFTFNSDGTFSYTPAEDFEGLDHFTYRIDDPGQWFEHNQTTGQTTYSQHNYSNVAEVWIEVGLPGDTVLETDGLVDDVLVLIDGDEYDDENENGVADIDERIGPRYGEAELVPVSLSAMLRGDVYEDDLIASLSVGHENVVRLWYDPQRTNELIPSISLAGKAGTSWLLSEMPSTIWIEAVSVATTWLTLQIIGPTSAVGTDTTFPGITGPLDGITITLVVEQRFNLTAYRQQTEQYGQPFQRTAVPFIFEEGPQESPAPHIRRNGDDDDNDSLADYQTNDTDVSGENDLIEVVISKNDASLFMRSFVERTGPIKVWKSKDKGVEVVFDGNNRNDLFGLGPAPFSLWVEWTEMNDVPGSKATLTAWMEDKRFQPNSGHTTMTDRLVFYPFRSVAIVLGGRTQIPSDPADPNYGTFQTAIDLYREGYDVHMYAEPTVAEFNPDNPAASATGAPYNELVSAAKFRNVHRFAIFGYSYGAGATYELSRTIDMNREAEGIFFSVEFTAYVDGIKQRSLGVPEDREPTTRWHLNMWQTAENPHPDFDSPLMLHGVAVPGSEEQFNVETVNAPFPVLHVAHMTIDDHPTVRDWLKLRFRQKVVR